MQFEEVPPGWWLAERIEADGAYCEEFEALDAAAAEAHCAERGWVLKGQLRYGGLGTLDDAPEVDAVIAALNERDDAIIQ